MTSGALQLELSEATQRTILSAPFPVGLPVNPLEDWKHLIDPDETEDNMDRCCSPESWLCHGQKWEHHIGHWSWWNRGQHGSVSLSWVLMLEKTIGSWSEMKAQYGSDGKKTWLLHLKNKSKDQHVHPWRLLTGAFVICFLVMIAKHATCIFIPTLF